MSAAALYKVRSVEWQRPFSPGPEIPCSVSLASHKEHQLCALVCDSPWVGWGNSGTGVISSEAVTRSTLSGSGNHGPLPSCLQPIGVGSKGLTTAPGVDTGGVQRVSWAGPPGSRLKFLSPAWPM